MLEFEKFRYFPIFQSNLRSDEDIYRCLFLNIQKTFCLCQNQKGRQQPRFQTWFFSVPIITGWSTEDVPGYPKRIYLNWNMQVQIPTLKIKARQ